MNEYKKIKSLDLDAAIFFSLVLFLFLENFDLKAIKLNANNCWINEICNLNLNKKNALKNINYKSDSNL